MVRSQLFYCTQIWHPHLMKDILSIEQIQHRATKFLLNDYTSNYKTHLVKLKILPLMYLFKLQDILFAIKSIKAPTKQFNIYDHIDFSAATTRSGTSNKMIILHHMNNISRHSYFHKLPVLGPVLGNALPIINLDSSFVQLKLKLKAFLFWWTLMKTTIAHCALLSDIINYILPLPTWTIL